VTDFASPALPTRLSSEPSEAAPEPSNDSTTLAVTAPAEVDAFDPSIEGVEPVTRAGTLTASEHADEIIASAAENGVTIERR
jgi:hypothetical protein